MLFNIYSLVTIKLLLFKCIYAVSTDMHQKHYKANLSALNWAHAVNSQKLLDEALHGDVDCIEADVVLGKLNNSQEDTLIMAHPPNKISDLSLLSFLQQTNDYNELHNENTKLIKLDYKSIEAFEESLQILKEFFPKIKASYPFWLNADILVGPVNATKNKPLDAKRFFDGCKQLPSTVLSIGWTTNWDSNPIQGSYSLQHITSMLNALKENDILEARRQITFPVRAGIAANSLDELQELLRATESACNATLSIWSSMNDYVNVEKLQHLISSIGVNRIYVDVPTDLRNQLNL